MKHQVILALTAILFGCAPAVCGAQDFSADVVYVATGKAAAPRDPSKLYVTKGKIRLETRGIMGTILLVNSDDNVTVALYPAQKAYQPLNSAPSQYFHVEDAENACPDWQKVSERKLDCEKLGHEVVDGRSTVKYQNKSATLAAPLSKIWIDSELKFVVKWEDPETGAELRNISKEAKLSSALFEIPAGFDHVKPKKKGPKSAAK